MRSLSTTLLLLAPLSLLAGSSATAQRPPMPGVQLAALPALTAALQRGRTQSSSAGRAGGRSSGSSASRSSGRSSSGASRSSSSRSSFGGSRSSSGGARSSGVTSSRSSQGSRSTTSGGSSRTTSSRSSGARSSSSSRTSSSRTYEGYSRGTTRYPSSDSSSTSTGSPSLTGSRETTTPSRDFTGSTSRYDSARTPSAGFGSSSSSSPVIDLRSAASPGRVRFPAPYRPATGSSGGDAGGLGRSRGSSSSGAHLIDRYQTRLQPSRTVGGATVLGSGGRSTDGLRTDRYTRGVTSDGGLGIDVDRTRTSGRPTIYGGGPGGREIEGGDAGGLTRGEPGTRPGTTTSGALQPVPVTGTSGRGPRYGGPGDITPSRGRGIDGSGRGLPNAGGALRPSGSIRPSPTYGGRGAIRPSHNTGWAFSSFGYLDGYGYGYGCWSPWRGRYCYGYWSWLDCWWYPFNYGWWYGGYYGYHGFGGRAYYSDYYDYDRFDDDTNITIVINDADGYADAEPVGEAVVGLRASEGGAGRASSRYAASAAQSYVRLGDQAFRENRYTDAVQLYAKAVEFQPEQGDLYLVLADALFAAGDYHYAAFAIRRALELEPILAEAAVDKHGFYDDPSLFDHQLAVLEGYLYDHPTDRDARLVLALNYLFSASPERTISTLENDTTGSLAADPAAQRLLASAQARTPAR